MTHAESASFWTHEGPGPEDADVGKWKDWSDYTFKDFTGLKTSTIRFIPPKAIFIPALRGPSEDVEILKVCLWNRDLPPKESAATFPIGSYCHELFLGTRVGKQVAKFLYEHKAKLGICTVVAIHMWDSGDGNTPAVLFSIQMYDEQVKAVDKENRDAHAVENWACAEEWPFNLKPIWRRPGSSAESAIVISRSDSQAS